METQLHETNFLKRVSTYATFLQFLCPSAAVCGNICDSLLAMFLSADILYCEPVPACTSRRILWCNAAGRGLIGHQLATAWVKVLTLCFTDDY